MDGSIRYLNTDLELTSGDDLTGLAAAFGGAGVFALHVTHGEDGLWSACFETDETYSEPEANIDAMLRLIEKLAAPLRLVWSRCARREFNVGYDCGVEPWAFNQGLSADVLGRIAEAGASLRVTLYPDRERGAASDALPRADGA